MSLINPKSQLLQSLEQARLMARSMSTMLSKCEEVGTAPNMPPSFFRSLGSVPPFEVLLNTRESGLAPAGSFLEGAIAPAVAAVEMIVQSTTPGELRKNLEAFVMVEEEARAAVNDESLADWESVEQVVDELKEDFILTLTTTLTGHSRLLELVQKWEDESQARARAGHAGSKNYYDFRTFELVAEDGPERVHMERFRASIEAGMATFIFGEGIVETEHTPPIQTALYGQWFTYVHSLWEDAYRGRLALAYDAAPDGEPWLAGDISSQFFSDIRNIRNDFVHSAGKAGRCLKNKLITGFIKGDPINLGAEQMMSLIDKFPEKELMCPPSKRSGPVSRTNLAWTASKALADRMKEVTKEYGMRGEDAVDRAVELWIEEQERLSPPKT